MRYILRTKKRASAPGAEKGVREHATTKSERVHGEGSRHGPASIEAPDRSRLKSKLSHRMGLLGCGGRGAAVATSFINNTTARYVALADLFSDQLEKAKDYFDKLAESKGYAGIDPKLLFRGPTAYQELSASDRIDAIHIATPGFFHVAHLEAAVTAGKHVYCEKPIGVDVVQSKHALEIGGLAEGKVSLDVGFQIRSAPPFVELVRRIHDGALGKIACISAPACS